MEEIKRLLKQVLSNLEDLEKRVSSLEANNSREKVVFEEAHLPEEKGLLGRKTLISSVSGEVRKVFRHPVCDNCGRSLNENFIVCLRCRRKICEKCAVKYEGKTYCPSCIRELIPLDKKDVKVLMLLSNRIRSISWITYFAGIGKEDIINSLTKLKAYNLISKTGLSVLSRMIVNDNGLSVLSAYLQIYRDDLDLVDLRRRINIFRVNRIW